MEIDLPDVIAEVKAAFERYEQALITPAESRREVQSRNAVDAGYLMPCYSRWEIIGTTGKGVPQ